MAGIFVWRLQSLCLKPRHWTGKCMRLYAVGKPNSNGDGLVTFISAHGLFVTNTTFKHSCRHRTTWTGHIKDHKAPSYLNATIAVYEFMICGATTLGLVFLWWQKSQFSPQDCRYFCRYDTPLPAPEMYYHADRNEKSPITYTGSPVPPLSNCPTSRLSVSR